MRAARYAGTKICVGDLMVRATRSGVNGTSPVRRDVAKARAAGEQVHASQTNPHSNTGPGQGELAVRLDALLVR